MTVYMSPHDDWMIIICFKHHMAEVHHILDMITRRPFTFRQVSLVAHRLSGTVLVTAETPSTNLVLYMTFALLNIPSFRDTTMNWEYGKWVLIILPMF